MTPLCSVTACSRRPCAAAVEFLFRLFAQKLTFKIPDKIGRGKILLAFVVAIFYIL